MSTATITRATAVAATLARARITRANGVASNPATMASARITAASAVALGVPVVPTIAVTATAGTNLEPWATGTLAASSPDSPDTWLWQQTSGPTVQIVGRGSATATFTAPPLLVSTDLTFRVTITKAGSTSATATVTFHVYLHTIWKAGSSGVLVPVQL